MTKPEKESKQNQQPTDASTIFLWRLLENFVGTGMV